MKKFKNYEMSKVSMSKIVGGNGGPTNNEDVPVTTLGTITHDDDI